MWVSTMLLQYRDGCSKSNVSHCDSNGVSDEYCVCRTLLSISPTDLSSPIRVYCTMWVSTTHLQYRDGCLKSNVSHCNSGVVSDQSCVYRTLLSISPTDLSSPIRVYCTMWVSTTLLQYRDGCSKSNVSH